MYADVRLDDELLSSQTDTIIGNLTLNKRTIGDAGVNHYSRVGPGHVIHFHLVYSVFQSPFIYPSLALRTVYRDLFYLLQDLSSLASADYTG